MWIGAQSNLWYCACRLYNDNQQNYSCLASIARCQAWRYTEDEKTARPKISTPY